MLIITDVTDKRLLESRVEAERNALRMVVNSILHQEELEQYVKEYQKFCDRGLEQILTSYAPWTEKMTEIFRIVHTFKGNFNQLELISLVGHLHELESWLTNIQKHFSYGNPLVLEKCLRNMPLKKWLEEDLTILQSVLGKNFSQQPESLEVKKNKSWQAMLSSYPSYVARLGKQLNKKIEPLVIEGGELPVNTAKYSDFIRSLVNVFHNMVDYGLEQPEERLQKNKTVYGKIECKVNIVDNDLELIIKDDGRGIDESKVRKAAVDQGIYSLEEVEKLTRKEILALIFMEGFSTADKVSQISGRGMGLFAVKKEVGKVGGRIEIYSEQDKGTEFRFILPI